VEEEVHAKEIILEDVAKRVGYANAVFNQTLVDWFPKMVKDE